MTPTSTAPSPRATRHASLSWVLAALASLWLGCATETHRYSPAQAKASLKQLDGAGMVIGEFSISKIIDGDTIAVAGLDSTLRLLAMDAEETFKNAQDERDADADFEAYLKAKRGGSARPTKAATPLGEAAKKFAVAFFKDVKKVRLERDNATEIRDRYDRYLAYVIVTRDGKELNYNVEAVRAGMSPYFTKYGYSRRFHADFVAAEKEARAAGRGIWDTRLAGYNDYEERLPWWQARAEFLATVERAFAKSPAFIVLTNWDAPELLAANKGKEVVVLGLVGNIYLGDTGPTRVLLSRRMKSDFPLIFFDRDVFTSTKLSQWRGEFVAVRGVVTEYQNKHTGARQLQIAVDSPDQIELSPIPGLDGTTPATFLDEALARLAPTPSAPPTP